MHHDTAIHEGPVWTTRDLGFLKGVRHPQSVVTQGFVVEQMTELPVKRVIGIVGNDQLAVLNAKDIPGIFSERLASNLGRPPAQ